MIYHRATVIVRDEMGRVLLTQMPRDHWMLPGGRMEHGETAEQAAARELLEETGLVAKELRFLFHHQGRFTVHHVFEAARYEGAPAPSNEIAHITWVPDNVELYRTYESSIEIIRKARSEQHALAAESQKGHDCA